jgi:transposase
MKKEIHNTYSLEFKLQAVLLSGHPDIQSKEVAELLNIHPFMLSRWKKEMKDKKVTGRKVISIPKADLQTANNKIDKLEKKLKKLKEENDILKKYNRFVAEKNRTSSK